MAQSGRRDERLQQSMLAIGLFLALLWAIKGIEWVSGADLSVLGVRPGQPDGLWGILFGPLIHGSVTHLAANSVGVLVLGTALFYGYPNSRWKVVALIWIGSGIGVWLFARPSTHYGASGVTHGLFFFLFLVSLLRRDKRSIALMMIAFFLFGGMIYSVFPREPGISYESHFAGAVAGIAAALLWWRNDPMPPVKRYDWEGEAEAEPDDDDVIGDLWQHPPTDSDKPRDS
ncbi:rhomboid family intramembrane serine protease [Ferrimonas balearica]|uniref:rhomboid family intramembrane serine protease n=1 Tax=Ferrimonas balearica TaxID=44012 RepID=UPI001C99BB63|nr:rhomboid family intramembrane serine protease [Ferrimonas balearica]MBY5920527.1 rhomboid family intramembrane serine protease [Ferrimonas balearica]MBY5996788.1 rhomboid family intramembrane serine protease [Ferrimonas balearica]